MKIQKILKTFKTPITELFNSEPTGSPQLSNKKQSKSITEEDVFCATVGLKFLNQLVDLIEKVIN